jgi:glycoside/pentoside/hexuronide:cation symporter, GPH family
MLLGLAAAGRSLGWVWDHSPLIEINEKPDRVSIVSGSAMPGSGRGCEEVGTPMRLRQKIGYATGDFGISIAYFAVGFFFLYYLTDIIGLSPELAGLAFFLGKLWDGVNDPIMGVLSDRTRSRFGRKRVYVLFGAFPLAVSFWMLWVIPVDASAGMQFVLATLAMMLFATAYTVVVVPYMALVPVMTQDYDERTQITGYRAILSTVASILGGGLALLLSGFTDSAEGLRTLTLALAGLVLATLLVAAQSVRGIEEDSAPDQAIVSYSLRRYAALATDRNVVVLLALKLLGAVGTGVLIAALPYFAKHILGDAGKSSIGLAIYVAMSAATIPIWNRLTHSFDKRRLLLLANVMAAAILLVIGFLVQPGQFIQFYLGCLLLGVAMSAYLLIPYSLVPDLVEYYEFKSGERHESIYFGLWISTHQLGISCAGLVLGLALGGFGYDGNLEVQTESALFAVRLALGVIPGLFLVLAALVLQGYGITRAAFEAMRAETELRKEAARAAGASVSS